MKKITTLFTLFFCFIINAQQDIVITQLATTGGNSGSRFYFDSSSSISGQDTFNFSYSNIGWQGGGGNSLLDQGLNPDYIISQILNNVPADGSILLPNQFNSYFSVGDVFSFTGQENVLANDDYITINYNENLTFDVRSNDADLEGEELTVSLIEGPESGTLTLNNDYTFTYTPVPNFSGEVNFTYEVSDGENSANASVTIKVNVVDTTVPVITLEGEATVTLEVGTSYTDAGATASDNYDGDITDTIVIVNNLDSAVVGTYAVTYNVSDANGNAAAEVTRTVIIVSSLSTEDNTMNIVKVYPNPVKDKLFISGNETPITVAIYNVLGKEVLSIKNTNNINVAALPSGVYIIRISDGVGQTNRKFIKN